MAEESEADLFAERRGPPASGVTRLSPRLRRLIAPNASAFTFNGTCTYILGAGAVAVVDPGPLDESHRQAVLTATAGEQIKAVLVTHSHRDHSPLAKALAKATGAAIYGAAPVVRNDGAAEGFDSPHEADYQPDVVLTDGERFAGDGFTLEAVATPGHCANHLSFALIEENALLSGDHVMAWSTSVIAPPDGSMSAYMASLEKLRRRDETVYWPGHGGPVRGVQRYLRALFLHRRQRETAILAALRNEGQTIPQLVAKVYAGLDPKLARAAGMSALAHLQDLVGRGEASVEVRAGGEARYRLR